MGKAASSGSLLPSKASALPWKPPFSPWVEGTDSLPCPLCIWPLPLPPPAAPNHHHPFIIPAYQIKQSSLCPAGLGALLPGPGGAPPGAGGGWITDGFSCFLLRKRRIGEPGAASPAELLQCRSHSHLLSKRFPFPRHPPKTKGRQEFVAGWKYQCRA